MTTIHKKKKLWQGDYAFRGRNSYSRGRWNVKLKDCIEVMFNDNIRWV